MPDRRFEIIETQKWVRVFFGNTVVADSKHAVLLRENAKPPVYYFPRSDVRTDLFTPTDRRSRTPHMGEAVYWTLRAGGRTVENAAWCYAQPEAGGLDLRDYVGLQWDAMDGWFEEDEEIFVHPRDPYTSVDVLASSRDIRIVIAGETIARTRRPTLLFETSLPVRFYLNKTDIRMDLLVPSDTVTACPYKGEAHYYSARVNGQLIKDIAWYYRYPLEAVAGIANRVCFYDERVDEFYVDDQLLRQPEA